MNHFLRTLAALFLFFLLASAEERAMPSIQRLSLTSGWTFHEASRASAFPAVVPGCVHLDLMQNGLIPDPFYGLNEQTLQWVGEKDWIYETTFDAPAEILKQTNIELLFQGLDTYATVILNDSIILSADNMFRVWRIKCKPLIREKANTLRVRFRNVFDENLPKYSHAPFPLQAFGNNDQADVKIAMYSRKAQFHYGWDWGPRLITCGIWRPVTLEAWNGIKINDVHVQQEHVDSSSAGIVSVLNVSSDADQEVGITVSMDNTSLHGESRQLKRGPNTIVLRGTLDKPKLWWTNGLGTQHLYNYSVRFTAEDGSTDEYKAKIGVRSLEIVREKDPAGRSLYVKLNGIPVFMKGANYIPQDNFQRRVTPGRYEFIIRSAAEANMNMLRVWGGGIYEEDLFYDLCDKYGILIWHDLMFACAMYPADTTFLQSVKQEVTDNAVRIRNHASLALYCGNNENDAAWFSWGWKKLYSAETQQQHERNHRMLFSDVIAAALKQADSTRYYHPTSPLAGFNDVSPAESDVHYWGVWHGKEPFEKYPDNLARFVSEYGFQSYPELPTVEKYTDPADRELHSAVMLSHQRCMADERKDREYGNRLIQEYMGRWYKTPKDFASYLYVSQVLQADGVRVAMEAHRRAMPYCMGSLYWQIDDCWPVASWSSIDYYGRWKALHYTARAAYAPVIISPVISGDTVTFYVVSDRLDTFVAALEVNVRDFRGDQVSSRSIPITVEANAAAIRATLKTFDLVGDHHAGQLVIVSRITDKGNVITENISYFRHPKDLLLERPDIESRIAKTSTGYSVELTSGILAKSVFLSCEDDSAFFSDNYFDVVAHAKKTIECRTTLGPDAFRTSLKITSLTDSY